MTGWEERGACREIGLGFLELEHDEQRIICNECRVRPDCAELAHGADWLAEVSNHASDVVPLYGGMTVREIAQVKRLGHDIRLVAA